jgi:hypothetical protein
MHCCPDYDVPYRRKCDSGMFKKNQNRSKIEVTEADDVIVLPK